MGAGRYRPRTGSRQAMVPVPVPYDIAADTRANNANVDTAAGNQASKDQMYENQTQKVVTKKKGKGFLNDVNYGALLRWLNENVSNTVTNAVTTSPMVGYTDFNKLATQKNLISAKDKVGQSRSFVSESGLNAIENIATGKGSRDDIKSLAYWFGGGKVAHALVASDVARLANQYLPKSVKNTPAIRGYVETEKLGSAGINKLIDLLVAGKDEVQKVVRNR